MTDPGQQILEQQSYRAIAIAPLHRHLVEQFDRTGLVVTEITEKYL
ncbi:MULTISPECIES: hypothetical protein [Trichocoleus]|uniref:Uncharacterized protein n=1 Tax=Trichocoleus desertorum GB2-A4 TaxID=2933944 RepID=A0ABV0JC14_9CYAN|nr:hypothetical protein [Trichocoleus sp. FACHB-46]MBD1862910.1 hypothetical protein [Trichocoleus sp. FACHB-46]